MAQISTMNSSGNVVYPQTIMGAIKDFSYSDINHVYTDSNPTGANADIYYSRINLGGHGINMINGHIWGGAVSRGTLFTLPAEYYPNESGGGALLIHVMQPENNNGTTVSMSMMLGLIGRGTIDIAYKNSTNGNRFDFQLTYIN